jgi:uncharacterized protein YkwD
MNCISKPIVSLLILLPSLAHAGFDFGGDGGGCNGGSGDFQQQINHYGEDTENAVTVGTIPKDLKDVYIALKSDKDVDIRLYNVNGEKIVHWPSGLLSQAGKATTSYNGVTIEYSGYNGDGSALGHEYIKISGTTENDFVMKAFGYEAGYAEVNYSWAGKANCSEGSTPSASGSGNFQQQIVHQDIVTVGNIPPDINNLYITLKSDKDVDIQLYDKDDGTKIVHWPEGILNGAKKQSTNYQGMQIEWSGFSGDGSNLGHEYIKIIGKTTRNLTMKAYGYQAGYAEIHYEWGGNNSTPNSNNEIPVLSTSQQNEYLNAINLARSVEQDCRTKGKFPATLPLNWSDKLYKSSYEHSYDLATSNTFSHDGSGTASDWTGTALGTQSSMKERIEHYNYSWSRIGENIAAGTATNTATLVVQQWLDSDGHCANIMNASFTEVGMAMVQNASSTYTHYWTQNFGIPN